MIVMSLLKLLLILYAPVFPCTCGSVPAESINSLEALYNSTAGSNWNWDNSTGAGAIWNFSIAMNNISNPCMSNWQGVICSNYCNQTTMCDIIGLHLPTYNLRGQLPSQIGQLTALTLLFLESNAISGTILLEQERYGTLVSL